MEQPRPQILVIGAFALSILLGGLNSIGVYFTVQEMPPFWAGAARFALAAFLFMGYAAVVRIPFPQGKALVGAVLYGVFGFGLAYAGAYWGIQRVQPGLAQVLIALVPLATILLAVAHRQERFNWRRAAGALVAVVGITVIFRERLAGSASGAGMLALLAANLAFGESAVVVKQWPRAHPVTTNAVAMAVGALLLLGASVAMNEDVTVPVKAATWIAFAYLVVVGSVVVFTLYLYILETWTASASSYQFLLFPLVSLPASVLLVHETLSWTFAVGGLFVVAGVYLGVFWVPKGAPSTASSRELT